VDAFATPDNARCTEFWTQNEDAFQQSWKEKMLWLNPPWTKYDQAAEKLLKDGGKAIRICPGWPYRAFFRKLMCASYRMMGSPEGTRVFEHVTRNVRPVKWPVLVLVVDGTRPPPRRMLDLFSGTGSAARVYKEEGFEVVTVDADPRWGADVVEDIRRWDYKHQYPPGYFHTIVCSPPCTEFSRALTTRPRDLKKADKIVRKTLEKVRYFRPVKWWLENPRNGLLKTREYMAGIPFVDAD